MSTKMLSETDSDFAWRDRFGNFTKPKNMQTRHLFYTLRMIWNHSMVLKFEPYNKYDFSPFYTNEYMATAIKHIVAELKTRPDIQPDWQHQINQMVSYLARGHIPTNKSPVSGLIEKGNKK